MNNSRDYYEKMRISQLKSLLQVRKLKVSGSKENLIRRLLGDQEKIFEVKKHKKKRKRGQTSSNVRQPSRRKRRKGLVSFEGVSRDDFNRISPEEVKKKLKGHVRKLEKQVGIDWHDGWEEQNKTIVLYLKDASCIGQSVLNVLKVKDVDIEAHHRIYDCMFSILDSWNDMKAVPKR